MRKIPKRPLPLGVDIESGEPINLGLDRLCQNVAVSGPIGAGKTQSIMLPLFQKLAVMPDVCVIAMTCKGDFGDMCEDWAIAHGLTKNLVRFKPGHRRLGFNPLRKNGWPPERHAKMARSAFLASRGEHSLDQMPQLARLIFLVLAVALEQGLSLPEAARLLRPGKSSFRKSMLRVVESEFLRESLAWFDALKDVRQEEISASTAGRLENFVNDPLIRATLTETECCLDVHDIIKNHKKLIADNCFFDPLVPDDARTMLRLLINTILGEKFATPKQERSPTILLLDEAPQFATMDLAAALELGRELQLGVVVASQFPSQYKLSKEDTRIFEAVRNCCRTRVLFPGMHVDELEAEVKDMMLDRWDPMSIKDQRKTLIAEPIETTREVMTNGVSAGTSHTRTSATTSAVTRGTSHGTSRQSGGSHAHSDAVSLANGSSVSSGMTSGETILPDGQVISIASAIDGSGEFHTESTTSVDSYGEFQSEGEQQTTTTSNTEGTQESSGQTSSNGWNQSRSMVPFHEFTKHWQWEKTYWQFNEFLTLCVQKIKTLPPRHFVIKVPEHKAVFVRAHFIREPWVPNAMRARALERIHRSLTTPPSNQVALPMPPAYQLAPPTVELLNPSSTERDAERDGGEWGS